MFKKILVPTDGSELAEKAVQGAIAFAQSTGAEVVGLTVIDPYPTQGAIEYVPVQSFDVYLAKMEDVAQTRLLAVTQRAQAAQVKATTVVKKTFSPYEAIIETAEAEGCDVIFMASHGRSGVGALLLGSETQKVLAHTSLPVLVYR
ncbi:universal stress protein [Parvibium lacunae]|uniref:Universal stress protein n=1 Tax=Parvibium lacunae TaxID=1888893 RepID=A0A368L4M1_9BURK|nr:universal stress protein [Parvibium lacunae]RCS58517.1 universal stress protein [Parvibium lacunae]